MTLSLKWIRVTSYLCSRDHSGSPLMPLIPSEHLLRSFLVRPWFFRGLRSLRFSPSDFNSLTSRIPATCILSLAIQETRASDKSETGCENWFPEPDFIHAGHIECGLGDFFLADGTKYNSCRNERLKFSLCRLLVPYLTKIHTPSGRWTLSDRHRCALSDRIFMYNLFVYELMLFQHVSIWRSAEDAGVWEDFMAYNTMPTTFGSTTYSQRHVPLHSWMQRMNILDQKIACFLEGWFWHWLWHARVWTQEWRCKRRPHWTFGGLGHISGHQMDGTWDVGFSMLPR